MSDTNIKFSITEKVYVMNTDYTEDIFHLKKGIIEEIILKPTGIYLKLEGDTTTYNQEFAFTTLNKPITILRENFEEKAMRY